MTVSDIYAPPNDYDFGLDFDYSVWTPNTQVDLVNVPWNNDYRDVVKFANRTELDAYIDDLGPSGVRITQLSYVKPNEPIRVSIPFNRAIKYNYLRASNPVQPIPSDVKRNFYYFILDVRYVAPMTTELVLQLDVFQTYIFDVTLGRCYVERGHIGIANENGFNSYGRDYLTVPEGLDVGSEYQVRMVRNHWIMSPSYWNADNGGPTQPGWDASRYPGYDILVFSTVDLTADPGTAAAPKLVTAPGGVLDMTTQGASPYIFTPTQWWNFLSDFQDKPWVTQGIVSITMIPRAKRYHPGFEYGTSSNIGTTGDGNPPASINHVMYDNWRTVSTEISNFLGTRYKGLKKFYTYPYMVIELTTFHGTPIILKPECWNTDDAVVLERATMVPPGARVEFTPRWYNSKYSTESQIAADLWPMESQDLDYLDGQKGDDWGEYIDLVTQIANFPTMAIVNNASIGYLAANVHGIAYQRTSADWTQQRALNTNQVGYYQQSNVMHNIRDQAALQEIGVQGQAAIGNVNTLQQGMASMAGGPLAGGQAAAFGPLAGAAGLALGVVSGALEGGRSLSAADAATQSANIQANIIRGSSGLQQRLTGLMRDTNKDLSDWAAKGDYANAIAGVNAKVQDAALIQPTTSGQMGGETINISNGGLQLSARWKMLDHASMVVVGEYWLRYGYAIRASIYMPPTLQVMTKFTYWKCQETYIRSSTVPEGFKQSIRGIFEKGVTVWNSPDDIGVIDWADNRPLAGIRY